MPQTERLSDGAFSGRYLYLLDLATANDLPDIVNVSATHFVCFLAWDSEDRSVETISRVAGILLDAGCIYFCSWGRGCERVHDIIDEVCVNPDSSRDDGASIMTTWHAEDSLDDALWFFLNTANPDEQYSERCNAALAVSIGGGPSRLDRIRFALKSPHRFSAEVLGDESKGAT